ncbi:adhesion G protein-coupled receptor E3 isoform X1 [Pogona vitticeps]
MNHHYKVTCILAQYKQTMETIMRTNMLTFLILGIIKSCLPASPTSSTDRRGSGVRIYCLPTVSPSAGFSDSHPNSNDNGIINGVGNTGIDCGHNAMRYNESTCVCKPGYKLESVDVTSRGTQCNCQNISHSCPEESDIRIHNSSWCLAVKTALKHSCEMNSSTTSCLENTTIVFKNFVQNITAKEDLVSSVTFFLKEIGSSAGTKALDFPEKQPETAISPLLAIQTNIISQKIISQNEIFKLEAQGDQMSIFPSAVVDRTTKGPVGVAFISFSGLQSLQGGRLLQEWINNETVESIHVNSRVVSASTSSLIRNVSSPVNLTFQHLKDKVPQQKFVCVHWNSSSKEQPWSTEGCQELGSNKTHSQFSFRYLPNFALLMATTPKQGDSILFVISNIGLSISLICLFLSIVTFLLCRSIQNHSTFIHLQLCLCLFFADLLFIIGIDKTYSKILCSIIAGMLHYLFLACFVWMFLEGVNLYLTIRNLKVAHYNGASKCTKTSMYLCGYGVPAVIVAISAGIVPEGYGTHIHCWLNHEAGFVWSFMGPVCAIIVVNSVLFCLILKNLHTKLASLNSEVTTIRNIRSLLFKAIAHVFILGVTWFIGLFQFGSQAKVMAYLFTITNSLQGIFIFLVHCLLNQKVRETYWQWICCSKYIKPPVSEMTLSTLPISSPKESEQSTSSVQQQKVAWKE